MQSHVSFTLRAYVENLALMGTSSIHGTGNALNNTIDGNSAANILNGAAGLDTMRGGSGNDTYIIDNAGDQAIEISSTDGTDVVKSYVSFTLGQHVEHLTLLGSTAIDGTGNELANHIQGNGVTNTLNGGAGHDTLRGGAGMDNFLFDSPLSSTTNVDRIADFSVIDDTIVLDQSIFDALSPGSLGSSQFHAGTAAQDAEDRIIHDNATGRLYYDADGNGAGAQVLFAQVAAGTVLTSADFLILG